MSGHAVYERSVLSFSSIRHNFQRTLNTGSIYYHQYFLKTILIALIIVGQTLEFMFNSK